MFLKNLNVSIKFLTIFLNIVKNNIELLFYNLFVQKCILFLIISFLNIIIKETLIVDNEILIYILKGGQLKMKKIKCKIFIKSRLKKIKTNIICSLGKKFTFLFLSP